MIIGCLPETADLQPLNQFVLGHATRGAFLTCAALAIAWLASLPAPLLKALGFSSLGKGQLGRRMMMEAPPPLYPVSLSVGRLPERAVSVV